MLTSFGRKIKQTNVLLGGLIFLLLIAGFIWVLFAKPQSAEKIKSLQIEKVQATLKTKEKPWEAPFTYKVVAEVLNSNEKFSVSKVSYIFEIKDKDQKIITKKEGTIEILAKEKKTIQEDLTINTPAEDVSFQLTKAQWQRTTHNP